MSLSVPVLVNKSQCASLEAPKNVQKIIRLYPSGGPELLATTFVLDRFREIQALRPGYFDGLITLGKAGLVYCIGGGAAVGTVGLIGCGVYKAGEFAALNGYWKELAGSALALGMVEFLGSRLGVSPAKAACGLAAMGVRDAAARAGEWSIGKDARIAAENGKKSEKCHEQIISELESIFDDMAIHLYERYELADKQHNAEEIIALKKLCDELRLKLPIARSILKKLDLKAAEVSQVTQKFEAAIQHLQTEIYSLKPCQAQRNVELIVSFSKEETKRLAVPQEIRERAASALQNRMGILTRVKGCAGAALNSGLTFFGLSSAGISAGLVYAATQDGCGVNILNELKIPSCIDPRLAILGASLGAAAALYAGKTTLENRFIAIRETNAMVEDQLDSCQKDLVEIYSGMSEYIERTPSAAQRMRMDQAWSEKKPILSREIENLGLGESRSRTLLNLL